MAGIGFELKRLVDRKSIIMNLSGYFYAIFASVGPLICCIAYLYFIRVIFRFSGLPAGEQNLLYAAVMYSFLGALLVSGLFNMTLSRYIADMIYMGKEEKIIPSILGALGICVIVCLIGSIPFFLIAQATILFKFLCYCVCVFLSFAFISMVYISAIKDYVRVTLAFLIGAVAGAIAAVVLIFFVEVDVKYAVLSATAIDFLVTTIILVDSVNRYFVKNDHSYYDFLTYVAKYPSLIFTNSFYMIALFAHNAIIWTTDIGMQVAGYFWLAPVYDFPAFIALLTIIPGMVIFVIKTETRFFDNYRQYIKMLSGGGTANDLGNAFSDMYIDMYNELIKVMQIQLIVTCVSLIASRRLFRYIGIGDEGIIFFGFLSIGYLCIVLIHIISTIILYFDDRKSALSINSFFLISQIVCVAISTLLGEKIYGLGTAVAGILTLIFAFVKLRYVLDRLDYHLYSSQPLVTQADSND